jgi:hypothetical protein
MIHKFRKMCMERVAAYFMLLCQHIPVRDKDYHEDFNKVKRSQDFGRILCKLCYLLFP